MKNQAAVLFARAQEHPHKIAIRTGDISVSYRDLWGAVAGLSRQLSAIGIRPGDRLGVLAANGPEPAIAYYAGAAVGAVVAFLPTDRPKEGLRPLLDLIEPGAVLLGRTFTGSRYAEAVGIDLAQRAGCAAVSIETAVGGETGAFEFQRCANATPHLILFTGGTTGLPKAVLHLEDRYLHMSELAVSRLNIAGPDVLINPYPAHHFGGLQAINQAVLAGAEVVQLPIPDEREILRAIERHRGSVMVAVPTLWRRLLAHPDFDACDLSSLRMANIASDFVPMDLIREVRARTRAVSVEGYGSTEAGLVTLLAPGDIDLKQGSCGLPDEMSELKIVNETFGPMPAGEVGRLLVRSRHMMAGYYRNEQATAAAFHGDWFITGDLAKMDSEGYVYITGRENNIISCGAEKLVPEEIEATLLAYPGIAAAMVVGARDSDMGEIPVAIVSPSRGAKIITEDIVRHTGSILGFRRRVRDVILVKEIPTTATGKIDRDRGRLLIEKWQGEVGRSPRRTEKAAGGGPQAEITRIESRIVDMWKDILGLDQISMQSGFFDLGGDSLMALRLALRIEEEFDLEIDPEAFLSTPTVAKLARLISQGETQ